MKIRISTLIDYFSEVIPGSDTVNRFFRVKSACCSTRQGDCHIYEYKACGYTFEFEMVIDRTLRYYPSPPNDIGIFYDLYSRDTCLTIWKSS